jgi:hypothetical protein
MYVDEGSVPGKSYNVSLDISKWPRGLYYIELLAKDPAENKEIRQIKKISVL